MGRKTEAGQIVIEFLVLVVCFCVLATVIKFKLTDLEKQRAMRWEQR